MEDMPRPRPPYLRKEVTRHGVTVWYVRKGRGRRIRIRAAFGSPGFMEEYQAALLERPVKAKSRLPAGSLVWLWERYLDSLAWAQLAPATQRQRKNVMARIMKAAPYALAIDITTAVIRRGIDDRSDRLGAARHFLETLRGLYKWAVKAELAPSDPTEGIDTPRNRKSTGYHVWTEEECQQYEARWPRGTWERLAFDVLLYTGLRRGDAVRVGRQHIRDGLIVIKTEKTGEEAYIPVLQPLREALEQGPTGDLNFIVGKTGKPLTKESFGNLFKKACKAAGVPGAAHGLRKAMMNRVAHFLTEAELETLAGWERGSRVAPIYTSKVVRHRLAKSAAEKLS